MRIGVTGHQYRESIDWSWVKRTLRLELSRMRGVTSMLSSLAPGSDQVCAEIALELGISVVAVIPLDGYERFFEGSHLIDYRRTLPQCEKVQLQWKGDPERAFLEAGKWIVDNSDILIAIWDGKSSEGLGGTADVVALAAARSRKTVRFDPIRKHVFRS